MNRRDVVISPFGGDSGAILRAAIAAEEQGYDGVWIFDHVSSLASVGAPGEGASRDPFTLLGAIAARTERVRLGVLVANIHNRHPAQLALAVDTLSGLAPGRVVCGIGAGAGAGSPFAREDAALGRVLAPAAARRALLAEHLAALRAIWRGEDAVGSVATHGLVGVVGNPRPPIVVGGGSSGTLALAAELADGVNIVTGLGADLPDRLAVVARARAASIERDPARADEPFEVSVFVADRSPAQVNPADVPDAVDRLTFLIRP